VPSSKQANKLPEGVELTSHTAQVLAGGYRKALGAKAPSLDVVANTLADELNIRSADQSLHTAWSAVLA